MQWRDQFLSAKLHWCTSNSFLPVGKLGRWIWKFENKTRCTPEESKVVYLCFKNLIWLYGLSANRCLVYFNSRQLLGEQLDPLTTKELQQLEQQLDSSLKHIRSRKVNKEQIVLMLFSFCAEVVSIWLFYNWNLMKQHCFSFSRISFCLSQYLNFRRRSVTLIKFPV
jgi:hypothetical protein